MELVIGARAMLKLSEIVSDPQILARLEGSRGTWGQSGDAVLFTTPNIGRAQVEIMASRVGHTVVSFHSHASQITDVASVGVEVVTREQAAERLKAKEEAQAKAEAQRLAEEEAQRQAEEEAARLHAEEEAKAAEAAARIEAEAKAESERLAAEEAERQAEAARLVAEQEATPTKGVASVDEAEAKTDEPPASDVVH